MNLECEILVVGAGPAGSMAAWKSARLEHKTILIEKLKTIGSKVRCGEGVNCFVFDDTQIPIDDSYISKVIDGTKFFFYNEIYNLTGNQWKGYVLDREIFDKFLAGLASAAGANVYVGTKAIGMREDADSLIVKVNSNGAPWEIEAKLVIGADGAVSQIADWSRLSWNRRKSLCKCFQFEVEGMRQSADSYFNIAFSEEFPNGFGWVFPKGNGRANVGIGAITNKMIDINLFNHFISEYPNVREMFPDGYTVLTEKHGVVPVGGPQTLRRTYSDRIILVGDAAGIVDPLTGEGIAPSMLSGMAAAEAASLALRENNCSKEKLQIYDDLWRSKRFLAKTSLGTYIDKMNYLRGPFFRAFSNKNIDRRLRTRILSHLTI